MDIIFIAVMAYTGTNIDDIFITALLFARADTPGKRRRVTAGRFAGIFILTGISMVGARGVRSAAGQYAHLMGILPLIMGIKAAIDRLKNTGDDEQYTAGGENMLLTAAGMTVASGGDNIGVYIPLLAGMTAAETVVLLAVFTVMTGLWCLGGYYITKAPPRQKILDRYKKAIVPVVYILLGLYILMG